MIRRTSTILLVSLLLAAFMAMPAFAAKAKQEEPVQNKVIKPKYEVMNYGFPDEWAHSYGSGASTAGRRPLANVTVSTTDPSPGATLGYTWYDYQHNGAVGRMVETGPHSGDTDSKTVVHFAWMHLPTEPTSMNNAEGRTYAYNAYKSGTGTFAGFIALHEDPEYSGYVNIDVTPDNRALVGGHNQYEKEGYQVQIHFDAGIATELFDTYLRVPDSLAGYEQVISDESLWPKFFFQFPADTSQDTVLHIVAQVSDLYTGTLMYYRKIGWEGSPDSDWDYPPYCVDSVDAVAQDITAERIGTKVAMSWFASLRYDEPDCDTCSSPSIYSGGLSNWDSDLYIQMSTDQGETWEPRRNLTMYEPGAPGYKPGIDASILYDQGGELHVLYNAGLWPADLCVEEGGNCFASDFYGIESRIVHWSETYEVQRFVCDATYPVVNEDDVPIDSCGPGGWDMRVAKMTLSECDGKLYAIWAQYHDYINAIRDDCAQYRYDEDTYYGPANAEIFVSISDDDGLTWDAGRNLTNSYTPGCDPDEAYDCQCDGWPSMNRWGRQAGALGTEIWTGATVVNPEGGAPTTDWFLDVMYVNDLSAGSIPYAEGVWTNSPMKWFRIPCVEPVRAPFMLASLNRIADPCWIKPGASLDSAWYMENIGNEAGTFSIACIEDNGSGWLSVGGFGTTGYSGSVDPGLQNLDTGYVRLDADGMAVGNYYGRLTVTGNDVIHMPFNIEIELIVTDTLVFVEYDSVVGARTRLVVTNNGNMGREGTGSWNMDYWEQGDQCDSGTTHTYLYEGTPVVGWLDDTDTVMNYTIWGRGWLNPNSFRPYTYWQGNNERVTNKVCGALNGEVVESGVFVTWDSSIAVEKIWVSPLQFARTTLQPLGEWDDTLSCYLTASDTANPNFIIQYMRVWSHDGAAHNGIMIGEAIDWDIPTDFKDDDENAEVSAANTGGFVTTAGGNLMFYCQGHEADLDTSGCEEGEHYMDERFGGMAMIESHLDKVLRYSVPYSGYTVAHTDSLQDDNGFYDGQLYATMAVSGYRGTDSVTDLHSAMCYEKALDFTASTVYEVVTVMATVEEGVQADLETLIDDGVKWFDFVGGMNAFRDLDADGTGDLCDSCCAYMGDFNHDRILAPSDIVGLINYAWKGGDAPVCVTEADVNGDYAAAGSDISYLINYAWKGGPNPGPCYGPFNAVAE